MLLIIPAIDIIDGRSAHPIDGPDRTGACTDPVTIAKLLRIENSKTLHVTDLEGASIGTFTAFGVIRRLVEEVDIPIEVSGGITTMEEADRLLDCGACRVVLHPRLIPDHAATAGEILGKHGPGKVVAAIENRSGPSGSSDGSRQDDRPIAIGVTAASMGFRRLLYTEFSGDGARHVINLPTLKQLAVSSGLRVTVSGGVASFEDLKSIQDLEPSGVDSVILRKSLYENRFACQKLWRLAEDGSYPYTAKV